MVSRRRWQPNGIVPGEQKEGPDLRGETGALFGLALQVYSQNSTQRAEDMPIPWLAPWSRNSAW